MSEIKISEHESFEAALKRFNRKIQQDGILAEARRRRHYESPSLKRKLSRPEWKSPRSEQKLLSPEGATYQSPGQRPGSTDGQF